MTNYRVFFSAMLFALMLSMTGCSSEAPAEASGEPVPADYEEKQAAAQKAAQEAAMKNAKRGRR